MRDWQNSRSMRQRVCRRSRLTRVREGEMLAKSRRIREYIADGNDSLCPRELHGTTIGVPSLSEPTSLRSRIMTNNPSARAAGTMETIQWYEKAGLHCRTNHRRGSSFSLVLSTPHPSISTAIRDTSIRSLRSSLWSPHLTLRYPIPHSPARVSSVSARVKRYPGLNFFFRPSLVAPWTMWKESYAAEWALIPERRLLRSTLLPPFVRVPAALRALLAHPSSAISQRCWLSSPIPLLAALTFRNHEWNDIFRVKVFHANG